MCLGYIGEINAKKKLGGSGYIQDKNWEDTSDLDCFLGGLGAYATRV